MGIFDIILITLSLCADNFAVSTAACCSTNKYSIKDIEKVVFSFCTVGLVCLLGGYYGGKGLHKYISSWDHILAAVILLYIGVKMFRSTFGNTNKDENICPAINMHSYKTLFAMAVATNIDVLAVGISMAIYEVNIWLVALFLVCFISIAVGLGFMLGSKMGKMFGSKAEFAGGIVLVLLSLKIFWEG